MNYFLAVDIGTTSLKAIAFNDKGEEICKHAVEYGMLHPQPAYSEQNSDEIFDAVVISINKILESLHPAKPVFISFSAMMHSLIAVDEKGIPITNCIIWADNRAATIAEALRKTEEGEKFYQATGVPVHAMSPLCKLLWLKEQQPEIFYKAHKFIGIKEYIFFRLFYRYVVDTAVASGTGMLNVYSLQWEKTILETLEVPEEKLSLVVPVETLFYSNENSNGNNALHLYDNIPFVIGGSDGALANLGTGSVAEDSMSVTIGTSAAVRILSSQPATEETMSIFCYHATGRQYIIGGASNNGAVVIQWLKDSILQTTESYEELFELAGSVPCGSDDLRFVPYILGERAPVWNAQAKGVFFGLTINHTKAHLIRAAMEGVTYNLYSIGKLIAKTTPFTEIYAAGGFAQSPMWLQVLSDVFNCKVMVSGSPESSALGAVMVGIKALNLPVVIQPSIVAEHHPNFLAHQVYAEGFQKFERLYHLFKTEFTPVDISTPLLI